VHRSAVGEGGVPATAGSVLRADRSGIEVATGRGSLRLLEVQLEGKRRMDVAAFLAGHRVEIGTRLGG
jgi:methionyl-tRNA formyltransferase